MVLSYTHNLSNIGNVSRATHQPIAITKNVDKSSPLLAQALANREVIDCTLDFFRLSAHGSQEKFYTVKITGGMVVDLTFDIPHTLMQSEADPQEHIAIRYRDITWTHHVARTSGYAFWGDTE